MCVRANASFLFIENSKHSFIDNYISFFLFLGVQAIITCKETAQFRNLTKWYLHTDCKISLMTIDYKR